MRRLPLWRCAATAAMTTGSSSSSNHSNIVSSSEQPPVPRSRSHPMSTILFGSQLDAAVRAMSPDDLFALVRGPAAEQAFPDYVYARAAAELMETGDPAAASAVVFGRLPAQRGRVVEAAVEECADWSSAWAWLHSVRGIESAAVMRAHVRVAARSGDPAILREALDLALASARRNKKHAGTLLPLFCTHAPPERWAEGVELLELAQASGIYTDITAVDTLLRLMLRAKHSRRVLSLWQWLKDTRAGTSPAVVSAVILAQVREGLRASDTVQLVQHLASQQHGPTPEAQLAVLDLLGQQRRPLLAYMEELVGFWHYTPSPLVEGAANSDGGASGVLDAVSRRDAHVAAERGHFIQLRLRLIRTALRVGQNDRALAATDAIAAAGPSYAAALQPADATLLIPALHAVEGGDAALVRLAEAILEASIAGEATPSHETTPSTLVGGVGEPEAGQTVQGHLSTVGLLLAIAAVTKSEAFKSTVFAHIETRVLNTMTINATRGGDDSSSSSSSSTTSAVASSQPRPVVFDDLLQAMLASCTTKAVPAAKALAVELAERIGADVPAANSADWYALMHRAQDDDAAAILEELGIE